MPNTRNTLFYWAELGALDPQHLNKALQLCDAEPQQKQWVEYLKAGLLWSAVLFSSLGILFFFAFNWQDMERFSKFALIEFVMLLAIIGFSKFSTSPLSVSISLTGMSLLTGALLALVGQTYQTGADPWQLFALWALLILAWAIIAHSDSLWILWIVLINTALLLHLDIHHGLLGFSLNEDQSIILFCLSNSALLIGFEINHIQPFKKQQSSRYIPRFLAVIAGTAITLLTINNIFSSDFNLMDTLLYCLWICPAYFLYRHKTHDLFILSAIALSIIVTIVALLLNSSSNMDGGEFLVITLTIITLSTFAGIWLKKLSKEFDVKSSNVKQNAD